MSDGGKSPEATAPNASVDGATEAAGAGPTRAAAPSKAAATLRAFHEEKAAEEGSDLGLLWRLLPFVRGAWPILIVSLALMPVVAAAGLVQPYLIKLAIDRAVVPRDAGALAGFAGVIAVALVGELGIRFAQAYLMQLVGQRVMHRLRGHLFDHMQRLRASYFDRTPVGRIVARVTNDVDALGEVFASGAVTALVDVLTLVGVVVSMLLLEWHLTLIAFAALPPLLIAIRYFRRYARDAFRAIRAKTAQIHATMNEQVQGVGVVQAYSREAAMEGDFRRLNADYLEANRKSIRLDAMLFSVVEAVSVVSIASILWYAGGHAVADGAVTVSGAVTIGTLVAFMEYLGRFFIPIRDFATKYTLVQSALASAERVFAFLDTEEKDAPPDPSRSLARYDEKIDPDVVVRFENVTFAYARGEPVLRGISFDVRRGERIALVGSTGAGKTTIASLLQRLYDVEDGRVLAFGEDVRAYDRRELRRRFTVVPQDVYLFSGTVLDNVAPGDVRPDRGRVEDALRRVGAWDLLLRRGEGLEAPVAERGLNFSAGERQLLALARALYRDAELLVLDEATASVDSETEATLQAAVDRVLRDRTSIVIAHRLSTIRASDRILVLHRGVVAE
ncbi:MAG: ABC transporter ATP-binding protein, partial [Deltaproteobacteria bacterium]|nr:ABC transporter ATP-binding protein [Deltaproteobacteria bacterium]